MTIYQYVIVWAIIYSHLMHSVNIYIHHLVGQRKVLWVVLGSWLPSDPIDGLIHHETWVLMDMRSHLG